jgi:hypothetical protein
MNKKTGRSKRNFSADIKTRREGGKKTKFRLFFGLLATNENEIE